MKHRFFLVLASMVPLGCGSEALNLPGEDIESIDISEAALTQTSRPFRMGFTAVPATCPATSGSPTWTDVENERKTYLSTYGDVVMRQFDNGVPWDAAYADTAPTTGAIPAAYSSDVQTAFAWRPSPDVDKPIMIELTFLDSTRHGLNGNWVTGSGSEALPSVYAGLHFNAARVKQAYKNFVLRAIYEMSRNASGVPTASRVKGINIVIEVTNFLTNLDNGSGVPDLNMGFNPVGNPRTSYTKVAKANAQYRWDELMDLYKYVYNAIKANAFASTIPVMFSAEYGPYAGLISWYDTVAMQSAINCLANDYWCSPVPTSPAARADWFGISVYPYTWDDAYNGPTWSGNSIFASAVSLGLPVAVTEGGYTSQNVTVGGVVFPSGTPATETIQKAWFDYMLAQAHTRNFKAIINWAHSDIDGLVNNATCWPPSGVEGGLFFGFLGLERTVGGALPVVPTDSKSVKASWNAWKALPLQ